MPETIWTTESLLIPYWKKRVERLLFGAPAGGNRARQARSLVLADEHGIAASEPMDGAQVLPLASKIRFPTFAAIGAADAALPAVTSSMSILGLELVGGLGGAGLMAVSALDLKNAKTTDERLDAINSLAWGTQAIFYLSSAASAHAAAVGFGLAGAATQAVVGVRRIREGMAEGDRRLTQLGALDLGSGAVWFAGTAFSWPLFLGAYALLMIGREAYVNDEAVRKVLQAAKNELRQELASARGAVAETADLLRQALGTEPLSTLAKPLP